MSKGVGGYVRRSERRYVPPAAGDGVPRCGNCRARLDTGPPHLCREFTFQTAPPAMGTFLHGLLNPEPSPGPPWTHTMLPPEPTGEDEDEYPVYPEPGPAFTFTVDHPAGS